MEQEADVQAGEPIAPNPEEEKKEPEKKPERVYTQEEFDRIAAKIRKNARYLGRKEAEAELLRVKPSEPEKAAPADESPKREQFETYEDFIEARADYRARKAVREESREAQKQTQEFTAAEQRQRVETEFRKRAEAAVKEIPDFSDVMEEAGDVHISAAMGDAIKESPIGPRILYELAKNPQEAERLAALSPVAAAREIGKIEARLEAGIKKPDPEKKPDDEPPADERNPDGTFKPKKEPSKAPPPPEPVGSRSGAMNDLPSDKDDAETWRRKEIARLNRLRGK